MPHKRLTNILFTTACFITMSLSYESSAQSMLKINAGSTFAYNSETPTLGEDDILVTGWGYQAHLDFVYKPDHWRFEPGFGGGIRQLKGEGSVGDYDISSETTKLMAILYCHYFITDHWRIGALFIGENNKDFEDWKMKSNDQHRFNAGLEMGYESEHSLGVFLRYTRSLYPNENIYLIKDPSDQITLGLFFKFFAS